MKRLLCIASLGTVLLLAGAGYGDEFSPDSIKSIMRKVAKYSFQQYGGGTAAGINRNWDGGTIYTGIMGVYRVTQDRQWLDSIDNWGTKWGWTWGGGGSPDDYCCLQTYCERYIVDPVSANVAKYTPTKAIFDNQLRTPVTNMFGYIDALYMGPPGLAMIGSITGSQQYFDSLFSAWNSLKKKAFDTTYGLWWRDANFVNSKTPTLKNPSFWGPGNAWVMGGWIRSLKYIPDSYPKKSQWVQDFKHFCDTIKSKQQPDGMWRTSLYEPTEFPDPEAGSTAFFSNAFSLGIVYGWLDVNVYGPVVRKAWSALVKCVDATGKVQRCQPWSLAPGVVGLNNTPEGQGALMLAGEGVLSIVTSTTINQRKFSCRETQNGNIRTGTFLSCFSHENRPIIVPTNAVSLTVFDVHGRLVWKKDASCFSEGQKVILPRALSARGVFYFRFD
jgi:unsaturated rhamnogalacturonyl hydrolase